MKVDEKKLVEQIKNQVKKAFDYKQEWTDQAKDNIAKFMNGDWRKNKKKEGTVYIPLIYWAIKTKLARDLEPLFTPEDQIGVKAVEPGDEKNAEITSHLVNYFLRNTPDIKIKEWMLHLQKRICGTSPYMCFWEYKIQKIRDNNSGVIQKTMYWMLKKDAPIKEKTVVRAYPNFEIINFFDFYIEPGAQTIDAAAYCGRILKMKLSDLKKKKDNYINLNELEKKVTDTKNSLTTSKQEESGVKPAVLSDDDITLEIIEHWTNEKWIMMSNDIIIKNTDNPFWHQLKPFGQLNNDPELLKFYGRGEPELGECLNDLYNILRKERITNLRLANDKIFMIKDGSNESYNKWKVKPGARWKVKNFNNVKEFVISDIKYSSRDEIELLRSEFERSLFVSGYQTGSSSPDMNDTATGVSVITFEANKIFTLHRQLDEAMGIERIGDFYIKLLIQYMKKPQVVRITGAEGEEWITGKPENLLSNYDLYATGTSRMVNKQAYLQQLINMYQLFQNDLDINKYEFKKQIFDASETKGKDKLLIKPEQLKLPGIGAVPGSPEQGNMSGMTALNLPNIIEGQMPPPGIPEMNLADQVNRLTGGLPKNE